MLEQVLVVEVVLVLVVRVDLGGGRVVVLEEVELNEIVGVVWGLRVE